MITRNGTDTVIGVIPGADIDEGPGSSPGGLTRARDAFQAWAGWKGKPALGSYTYPAGGKNETWDFARAAAAGPMSYRAYAIPNGFGPTDVRAGTCDAIWHARAAAMVAAGAGEGWYFPGYEGDDHQFNGSAGRVGFVEWAYAVSRQIRVMRSVTGWDNWVGINFNAHRAWHNNILPAGTDPFAAITEPFQSIDLDLYPVDDWSGSWSASTDQPKTWAFMLAQLEDQAALAAKHGVPLGIGEYAPMLRSDGHATNDDPVTVAWMSSWVSDPANNVAHLWLFDGSNLPGDNCRFATYNKTSNAYLATPALAKAAVAVAAYFDPAHFVGRTPTPPPPPPATVEQLLAELAQAQATIDGQQTSIGALGKQVADLTNQLAAVNYLLTTNEDVLAAATTAARALLDVLAPQPTTPGGTS